MTSKRIYLVEHQIGQAREHRLVEAPNQAQAVAHVVKSRVKCAVATQEALVTHLTSGTKVERAGEGS